jgi:lipopolysaccharide/colanic/teichoic acid biosynthesis glycosyltransferase
MHMSETATSKVVHLTERSAVPMVSPRVSGYTRFGKRAMDVLVSLLLVVIAVPFVLLVAFAVRVGLGSGVFYGQERVGRNGAAFTIWKFRTMSHDRRKEQASNLTQERRFNHKVDEDPRHTGLGRLLRRMSLDELPQLWNVLRGDMSLVGPRPELVEIARQRGYLNHVRHEVRPGITGPYQISMLRPRGDLRDGLELDTAYVREIAFRRDVSYLFRTLQILVFGHTSGG